MNRRSVLVQLSVASAGVMLWPACRQEPQFISGYPQLKLTQTQVDLLNQYGAVLLPIQEEKLENPESRTQFLLTMLNDVHSPENINSFINGLQHFEKNTKKITGKIFLDLDIKNQLTLIRDMDDKKDENSDLSFFHRTIKNYTLQYFTGSKYYLTEHLGYAMIPGKYQGCVAF